LFTVGRTHGLVRPHQQQAVQWTRFDVVCISWPTIDISGPQTQDRAERTDRCHVGTLRWMLYCLSPSRRQSHPEELYKAWLESHVLYGRRTWVSAMVTGALCRSNPNNSDVWQRTDNRMNTSSRSRYCPRCCLGENLRSGSRIYTSVKRELL